MLSIVHPDGQVMVEHRAWSLQHRALSRPVLSQAAPEQNVFAAVLSATVPVAQVMVEHRAWSLQQLARSFDEGTKLQLSVSHNRLVSAFAIVPLGQVFPEHSALAEHTCVVVVAASTKYPELHVETDKFVEAFSHV